MKKLLMAGTAVATLSMPAFAADMPVKAVPTVPVAAFDWSGFYIGGDAGWQGSKIGLSDPNGGLITFAPHHDSFAVGAHVGAQRQWGQLVLGVEGGYTAGFGRASLGLTPGPLIFFPGLTGTGNASLKDIWSVGGRAGWAMGNWMPYIAGGYANGTFKFNAQDLAATAFQHGSATPDGAYIGGGIDWAFTNNWIFGVEYRHYGFSAKTVIAQGVGTVNETVRFDPKTDTVMAHLSYKFDWGKAPVVAKY
jgi:outer membrane immunogenic protein